MGVFVAAKPEPGKIPPSQSTCNILFKFSTFKHESFKESQFHLVLSNQVLEKEEEVKEEKKKEVNDEEEEEEEESVPGSTLFIKNLNFSTTEEKLQEVGQFLNTTLRLIIASNWDIYYCFLLLLQTFSKCGKVKSCSISKKKDKTGTKH